MKVVQQNRNKKQQQVSTQKQTTDVKVQAKGQGHSGLTAQRKSQSNNSNISQYKHIKSTLLKPTTQSESGGNTQHKRLGPLRQKYPHNLIKKQQSNSVKSIQPKAVPISKPNYKRASGIQQFMNKSLLSNSSFSSLNGSIRSGYKAFGGGRNSPQY